MIDVRGVTRRFDGVVALSDASFQVNPGEIVALLGPNGAGKTTASRIIGGILAPTEGDVLVDGVSVREDANAVRARCGFVTDQPSLYERMPLRSYLAFFARLYDVASPDTRPADIATARAALVRAGISAEAAAAQNGLAVLRFATDDPATTNPTALRALLDAGVRVVTLSAEERSLEDAYLAILAEARR